MDKIHLVMQELQEIPGLGRPPEEGHGNSLQTLPENPRDKGVLEGYSPQGHKELATTAAN